MPDKYFLSSPGAAASSGPLHTGGERVLWSGHCAVAEYAFEEPASLPRWTLPEETEVVVTEERVIYRDPATLGTGELPWRWPQHLRVQPGNRETGRSATVTQIQLVCGGPAETFPALVFAGGELATVGDADRLANVLRQAIARYRVEHAADLGLTVAQARMLSRLVIGPEFTNYQGGEGQTVSLLGALPVQQQPVVRAPAPWGAPAPASPAPSYDAPTSYIAASPAFDASAPYVAPGRAYNAPAPAYDAPAPAYDATAPISPPRQPTPYVAPARVVPPPRPASAQAVPVPAAYPTPPPVPASRPVVPEPYPTPPPVPTVAVPPLPTRRPFATDYAPRPSDPQQAAGAQLPAWESRSDLASRAADLAARVAMLVGDGTDAGRSGAPQANLSAFLDPATDDRPTAPQRRPGAGEAGLSRAESVRRTAARLAGNAPRGAPPAARRADEEVGTTSRGGRRR